jgi:trk system potassium uptake protein TrkH
MRELLREAAVAVSPFRKALAKLTPTQWLLGGYALFTLAIAGLLTLPIASSKGVSQSFTDALFMACSGVSTTGLAVVDLGQFYSLFGQLVMLIDFQIGGVGYMTVFILIMGALRPRLPLSHRLIAQESLAGPTFGDIIRFFKWVAMTTFLVEFACGAVLACYWMRQFSVPRAIYLGFFHSISAFCTAGFCLFPDSLMSYHTSFVVNIAISVTSIVGGIGFLVLGDTRDLCRSVVGRRHPRGLSVHSKLVLTVTAIVMTTGGALLYFAGKWPSLLTQPQRVMISAFQAVSASTTDGYNTVDIGALGSTSLAVLMLLMFIGASPGSTGGGVKTTTVGILWASLWAQLRRRDVNVFRHRISDDTLKRAYAIFAWFLLIVVVDALILTATEKASFVQVLFEIVSALGNAGLSTGITPSLSEVGRIVLSVTMFIGRVGPLAVGIALMVRAKPPSYSYAEADVFVG